jgi:hypothetical protein
LQKHEWSWKQQEWVWQSGPGFPRARKSLCSSERMGHPSTGSHTTPCGAWQARTRRWRRWRAGSCRATTSSSLQVGLWLSLQRWGVTAHHHCHPKTLHARLPPPNLSYPSPQT